MYKKESGDIPAGWSKVGQHDGPDWDSMRNFARQALVFHDREVGLEAELWTARKTIKDLELEVINMRHAYETSLSWRIGRFLLLPARTARRISMKVLKFPRTVPLKKL